MSQKLDPDTPTLLAVEGDEAGPIWLAEHGCKRHIADWETFQALGFDLADVKRRPLLEIARLRNGSPLALPPVSRH